ncbi:MAG: hypothetical protein U5J95_04880 [Balneolaceae bacterium]|nr:hypothetical protein [Balneolaceae bacterium]
MLNDIAQKISFSIGHYRAMFREEDIKKEGVITLFVLLFLLFVL